MDSLLIEGGQPLRGRVRVAGAKNAALPILASSLLTEGRCTFRNVPALKDVDTTGALLQFVGASVDGKAPVLHVDTGGVRRPEAPYELVKQMRASVLVLGPLLARFGRTKVSLPGGCAIGARPIDQHLKGLEAMGARIVLEHGYVIASSAGLRGAEIVFDLPTVTGTENLMMAAVLAKGRTTFVNAAREPEVEELARVLNKMGARVQGAGTAVIHVEGVKELAPIDHAIIPDRIEAGTFLVAAAATGGNVLVENCVPEHLDAVLSKLREADVTAEREGDGIRVVAEGRRPRAVHVRTAPFPGFPTDMQAQFMVLMALADGESRLTETIFENRFMHVAELRRMGARVDVRGNCAFVSGVESLSGTSVMATDLRASASLVIAGLVAGNTTEVRRVYHLDRGYERIEERLGALGARIRRAKGEA